MIFYESFYEACKDLPDAERLAAYDAILGYGCEGKLPERFSGTGKAIFTISKPLIDANAAKKAAGARGGRPRKDESAPAPPTRRSGKFVNFTPSDTDWDAAASQIMARQ